MKKLTLASFVGLVGVLFFLINQTNVSANTIAPVGSRSTVNRPDETGAAKVQAVYVLPSDGVDQNLDTDGRISDSVNNFQMWLRRETQNTQEVRMDTYQGKLDILFYRLPKTEHYYASQDRGSDKLIEDALRNAQLINPGKIYAIYYGGRANNGNICGTAQINGQIAITYLKLTDPGAGAAGCTDRPLGLGGHRDLVMLHELIHAFGFTPACAPNSYSNGAHPHHIDDDSDLMTGEGIVDEGHNAERLFLDPGNDDYYGHNIPNCPDLVDSPYMGLSSYTVAPAPAPTYVQGATSDCPTTINNTYGPTLGRNVLVRSFINCVKTDSKIGGVEVHIDSVGSTYECPDRNNTTSTDKLFRYGETIFSRCPIATDLSPKKYVVSYIARPGYHVSSQSPTKVGTEFNVHDAKTPILNIVMEEDYHPWWWWASCDSTGQYGNPDNCG